MLCSYVPTVASSCAAAGRNYFAGSPTTSHGSAAAPCDGMRMNHGIDVLMGFE